MSYHRWGLNAYEDDRRRPYRDQSRAYEGYKPTDSSSPPRGHSGDSERNREMEVSRRDPRDSKDTRPAPRSPRSIRRDADSSRNLHIDTKVVDGSRRNSPSSHSSSSAFPAAPTEPAADRMAKSNNQLSSAATPVIPKAKDPKVQDVFEAIYKWNETLQERMLLKLRKSQLSREDQKRQNEVTKIASKVNDYAPWAEFQRRFEESGKAEIENVSKHLADLDRQYVEDLEKVVATVSSHSSTTSQAAAQTQSLSALETKFTEFQKQNSEQQKQISEALAQIQVLSDDRDKTTKALDALDKDFKDLKADYNTIQSENLELKLQVADLESTKATKDDLGQLSQTLQSFMTRLDKAESRMDTLITDLDIKTYNEILDAWIGHDFKNMVVSNKKTIAALRQDFQSFQQSTTSQFDASNTLARDIQLSLETLKSSQPSPPEASTQTPANNGQLQQTLQTFVEGKLMSFNEVIQKTVADSGDACADMVDEVRARIDNIETTVNTLAERTEASPKASSKQTDVAARINSLEKFATKCGQVCNNLRERVESLEGQRLGPRIDIVDLGLVNLEKKVQNFQETNASKGSGVSEAFINSINVELENARDRFHALEMAVRAQNSQWLNLNTKQMADIILGQLDPYGQRNHARVAAVENELKGFVRRLSTVEENIMLLLKEHKKDAELAKEPPVDGKREAPPGSLADEPTKKRKLGPNNQPEAPGMRGSSLNL
ncbi:hypothetical protein F5Y05DRAFT_330445 [Hypoxylon sp. FL0543]|nr:hypothetical protein F5Y05DRAFT_330445 [Hypoxylon sp. FL0543]